MNTCVRFTRTGSILISVDPVKQDTTNAGAPSGAAIGGDVILIASASLWSMVMVRQSKHAPHFSPVTLATIKVSRTALHTLHPLLVKSLCLGLCVVVCHSKHARHVVWLVGVMPDGVPDQVCAASFAHELRYELPSFAYESAVFLGVQALPVAGDCRGEPHSTSGSQDLFPGACFERRCVILLQMCVRCCLKMC